jgi:drug/metabolite transporter (DMT)-like permease
MIGSLNKLPLAFLGLFLFDDPFTLPKVAGLLIATSGGYLYTRAKQGQNAEKARLANVAAVELLEQDNEERSISVQMESTEKR